MISALIKENWELHRQMDKLSNQTVGAASGTAERVLRSLERRVRSSLDAQTATGRRRLAGATSTPSRKVTDPELLERRHLRRDRHVARDLCNLRGDTVRSRLVLLLVGESRLPAHLAGSN
jgi:hypothetical protein